MEWDDSYRYFPAGDNKRVETAHRYFDTVDDVESLSAATRFGQQRTGTTNTSYLGMFTPMAESMVRFSGWIVVLIAADYLLGMVADSLAGRTRNHKDIRWGPLVRVLKRMLAAPHRANPPLKGPPLAPSDLPPSRFNSPIRPTAKPSSADGMPRREGSLVRSDKPLPPTTEASASSTIGSESGPHPHESMWWLVTGAVSLLRGLCWTFLWIVSVCLAAIPRGATPQRRGQWSTLNQVQRRVDNALKMLTPPTAEEALERELEAMLKSVTENGGAGHAQRPRLLSHLVDVSRSLVELQRVEACKNGQLISPSTYRRDVPHMRFGGGGSSKPSQSSSSLAEVYDLWDRLLAKGFVKQNYATKGAANNEALLREVLLGLGIHPSVASRRDVRGPAPKWVRDTNPTYYGRGNGSPPRLSRLAPEQLHSEYNPSSHDGPTSERGGGLFGEVEQQLQNMLEGRLPGSHRSSRPILSALNPMAPNHCNQFGGSQYQPPMNPQHPGWGQQLGNVHQQQQFQPNMVGAGGGMGGVFAGGNVMGMNSNNNWASNGNGAFNPNVNGMNQNAFNGNNNNAFGGNANQNGFGANNAFGGNNNNNQNAFSSANNNAFSNTNNQNAFSNNNQNAFSNNNQNTFSSANNNAFSNGNNQNAFSNSNNNQNAFNNNNNAFKSANNNNNAFGGNANQNGFGANNAFGSNSNNQNAFNSANNVNNNNAFNKNIFEDDFAPTGRATNNNTNGAGSCENNMFTVSPVSPACGNSKFSRPPSNSPPINGFPNSHFDAPVGPRRAPAPCRGNDDLPASANVRTARGGIAIEVDVGPTIARRPPLSSRPTTHLSTPARPTANESVKARLERRQLERATMRGTTSRPTFNDRVSTPADADWGNSNLQRGGPGGRNGTVQFDEIPVGGGR